MRIEQGTLPNNFTSVNPATFLEAWISGTSVFELPGGAFKDGQLQFVISSTEAPPAAERTVGMLWFRRGDGHLYVWDQNDAPSTASSALGAVVNWLSISDRRDIWGRPSETRPAGTPYYWAVGASNTTHFFSATGASMAWDPYFGRIMWNLSCVAGNGSTGATAYKVGVAQAMTFIALDTPAAGLPSRFVEWGFCDVYMDSGVTAAGGPLAVDLSATLLMQFGRVMEYSLPAINSQAVKHMYIGHAIESTASAAAPAYARRCYKYPTGCWAPNGGVP